MRRSFFALVLAAVVPLGCGGGPAEPAQSSEAPPAVAADAAGEAAAPASPEAAPAGAPSPEVRPGARLDRILAAHDDDAAFLDGLRAPRQRRAAPVENRHDPAQTDTVHTLVYDGLTIEAYDVTGGPTLIQRVAVTGGGYGTADGLAVGEDRAEIESVLGAPVATDGDRVAYESGGEPTPTRVEVVYEPDADGVLRASEIVWLPYVD